MSKNNDPFELDYIPPVVAAAKRQSKKFAVMTLGVIGGLFLLFILWASLMEIDEIVHGNGRVIPSQKTQVMAHLEGGILREVYVKEGDMVKPGQLLMKVDATISKARLGGDREQYYRFKAASARLRSQLSGEDFVVPDEVMKAAPEIASEEMQHYKEALLKMKNDLEIRQDQVEQKEQELNDQKARLEQAKKEVDLATQEQTMIEPLVKSGLTAKRDLLRLQRDIARLNGDIASGHANVAKAEEALQQAQKEFDKTKTDLRNENLEQLRDMEVKLSQARGGMQENLDRVDRTEIRASVKGIVKDIKQKSIGGVIKAGDPIIEVVPLDDTLLVEAEINPRDVAFLHPGQKSTVKVTAYDYAVYGGLKADLEGISADSSYDEKQQKWFYKIWVRTDKNYVEKYGQKLPIIPGMTTEVDIMTGKRTVMTYILKPIIRGLNRSFTER